MPRIIQIAVSPDHTDDLLRQIKPVKGIIGLHIQPGISLQPPGDVVTVEVTNQTLSPLMRLLDREGIGANLDSSISTSEPTSLISSLFIEPLTRDTSKATWEEMEMTIGKESNTTANTLLLMILSGVLATVGIATNALHIVIGAITIALGFEPITRIALGLVSRNSSWRRGLSYTFQGYMAMFMGAVSTTFFLNLLGESPLEGRPPIFPKRGTYFILDHN